MNTSISFSVSMDFEGDDVVKECFGLDTDASQNEIRDVMAGAYCNPRGEDQSVQQLDFRMKEKLNKFSEQINRFVLYLSIFID